MGQRRLEYLLPDPSALGLIWSISQKIQRKNCLCCQWRRFEESGQWDENID